MDENYASLFQKQRGLMANNTYKWKAAERLFKRNQRCPDPPHFCAFVEGKCEGCEVLKDEIKKVKEESNAT